MRTSAFVVAFTLASGIVSSARADEKQACSDAYQLSQTLRDQHKLVKAREQLRICAAAACPGFITKECTGWLKDVDPRVPSVVLTAKNTAGADVTDVRVTIDGAPLATTLDGIAIDVDPGPHSFAFEGPDGRAELKVVVTEGTKAQRIAAPLGVAGAIVAPTPEPVGQAPSATSASPSRFSQPVDNGLSLGLRLGYGISFGSIDTVTTYSDQVSGQVPIWFDVGYLLNPYFYIGAYLSYGILSVPSSALAAECSKALVSCSGNDLRVGVDVQVRLLGKNRIQPWLGLGFLGYEGGTVTASGGGTLTGSVTGIEWVSPKGGFDYKVLPTLSVGGFVGVSLGQFLGRTIDADGIPQPGNELVGHALHGSIFIGARTSFDLHI